MKHEILLKSTYEIARSFHADPCLGLFMFVFLDEKEERTTHKKKYFSHNFTNISEFHVQDQKEIKREAKKR